MRNIKKFFRALLVLSIVLQSFCLPVFAENRNPYVTNLATSIDDKNGAGIQVLADRVGAIQPGNWVCFKAMDFGKSGPESVEMETTIPEGSTLATIRIDKPDGEIIAEIPVVFSSGWGIGAISATEIKKKVTGVHDIYISGNKSSLAFRSIVFYEKGIATESFSYEMYSPNSAFTDLNGLDCAEAVNLLNGLGIIPDSENGLYEPKKAVSRGEFAYSIYRLFVPESTTEDETKNVETVFSDVDSDYKYAEAIAYVSQNGIVNGVTATEFDPYAYITYRDALVVILRALGYSQIAESAGGYPNGYINAAIKAKIGISGVEYDDYLKKGQMALLLETVLDADYITLDYISNGELALETENGILGATQNLYSDSGFVSATEVSMFNMPDSGLEHGFVSIDDDIYRTGKVDVLGLLGFECDFWYEIKDDIKTLKYIAPKNTTTYFDITSAVDEIYSITDEEIKYCLNGESKEKEIKIDSNVSILYNGVAVEGKISDVADNTEEFKGTIRVVKNGNKIGTILIEEYEDYIIESIDYHTSMLKGKGVADEISLDAEKNLVVLLDAKSKETTADKLNVGQVITVYSSKNTKGPKLVRGYVSDKTIQGTVTGLYDDEIRIDGKSYKKSNNYSDIIKNGQSGIFNLNVYGELVSFSSGDETEFAVGLFLDVKVKEQPFDKEIYVKLVDNTGVVKFYPVAERVTYNGRRCEAEEILSDVTDGGNVCKGLSEITAEDAIRFKLNSEGQLSVIDTCDELAGGSNDSLKKLTNTPISMRYVKSSGILLANGAMKYYMDNNGIAFAYYRDVEDKEKFWGADKVSVLMPSDATQVSSLVYSTTGNEHEVDILVFSRTIQYGREWNEPIIVTEVANGIDDEGNEGTVITGMAGNGAMITYTANELTVPFEEEKNLLENVQTGDVIRVKRYMDMIVDVGYVFFCDGAKTRNIAGTEVAALINKVDKYTTDSDIELKNRYVYGSVEAKTDKYLVVKTGENQDGTSITETVPMPGKVTLFYMRNNGQNVISSVKGAAAVKVGDNVTVIIYSGKTSQVIVNDID